MIPEILIRLHLAETCLGTKGVIQCTQIARVSSDVCHYFSNKANKLKTKLKQNYSNCYKRNANRWGK